jgi:hypothetical protein
MVVRVVTVMVRVATVTVVVRSAELSPRNSIRSKFKLSPSCKARR